MKRKIVKVITLTIIMCFSTSVNATITDVSIVPSLPTPLDVISIDISGEESTGDVSVAGTDFRQDGVLLELDIFLDVGVFQVVTPWSHTENIGTLPVGRYDLTVRTLEDGIETYTYPTSFEVVPEPTTILLLGIGAIVIRRGNRAR